MLVSCAGPSLVQEETPLLFSTPADWDTLQILTLSGIGSAQSKGFITTTLYIPDIKRRLFECKAELHKVQNFAQKLCLGVDFIKNYSVDLLLNRNLAHFTSVNAKVQTNSSRLPTNFKKKLKTVPVFATESTFLAKRLHNMVSMTLKMSPDVDYMFESCYWEREN